MRDESEKRKRPSASEKYRAGSEVKKIPEDFENSSTTTLHPSSLIPHPYSSFRPSKRFGQNFLTDPGIIKRIIDALNPQPNETIVEIGPGQGALTETLVERAGTLVAIEFDRQLVPLLSEKLGSHSNFRLIEKDALVTNFCTEISPSQTARVVANLPYNISTAILQRLIEQRACLSEMVLMLQREVVDRITAGPGSKERGYLSVLIEAYCDTEKLFDVAPGSFRPAPKVWSSVVRLRPRKESIGVRDERLMWSIVSAGFAQRRKTMLNNLRVSPPQLSEVLQKHGGASIVLCRAEVELQRRAETLSLEEWIRIANAVG